MIQTKTNTISKKREDETRHTGPRTSNKLVDISRTSSQIVRNTLASAIFPLRWFLTGFEKEPTFKENWHSQFRNQTREQLAAHRISSKAGTKVGFYHALKTAQLSVLLVLLSDEYLLSAVLLATLIAFAQPAGVSLPPYLMLVVVVAALLSINLILVSCSLLHAFLNLPIIVSFVSSGVLISLSISSLIWLAAQTPISESEVSILELTLYFLIITSAVVFILYFSFGTQLDKTVPPVDREISLLLAHIPVDDPGPLYHLKAEDHYLHVVAQNGSCLIRRKLSETVDKLPSRLGVRVHRSHWITFQAIKSFPSGYTGKARKIELKNCDLVPVNKAAALQLTHHLNTTSEFTV